MTDINDLWWPGPIRAAATLLFTDNVLCDTQSAPVGSKVELGFVVIALP